MSQAPQRDPTADRETLRNSQGVIRRGNLAAATDLAETALASGLEHPFLFNLVATRHEDQGRLDVAVELLRRGLALQPEDAGCLHALGLLLNRLEAPAE